MLGPAKGSAAVHSLSEHVREKQNTVTSDALYRNDAVAAVVFGRTVTHRCKWSYND